MEMWSPGASRVAAAPVRGTLQTTSASENKLLCFIVTPQVSKLHGNVCPNSITLRTEVNPRLVSVAFLAPVITLSFCFHSRSSFVLDFMPRVLQVFGCLVWRHNAIQTGPAAPLVVQEIASSFLVISGHPLDLQPFDWPLDPNQ